MGRGRARPTLSPDSTALNARRSLAWSAAAAVSAVAAAVNAVAVAVGAAAHRGGEVDNKVSQH